MELYIIKNFAGGYDESVTDEMASDNTTQDSQFIDYTYEKGAFQRDVGERAVGITSISFSINYPFIGDVQNFYEGNIAVADGDFENKRLCVADGILYQFCAGNQFIPLAEGSVLFVSTEVPDFTHFTDTFYITGGYDRAIREWDGLTNSVSTNIALEAGANRYRAKCIEVFHSRLFIGNTSESADNGVTWNNYEHRIRYSDIGKPNVWDAEDATWVNATNINIEDKSGDEILRLINYADSLLIFKRNSLHKLIDTAGGTLLFEDVILDANMDRNCPWTICQTPLGLMFLNNEGIQLTDGNTVTTLEHDIKITQILKRIYKDSLDKCFAVAHEARQEYWISMPLDGSSTCNYILVYNWKHGAWRLRKTDSTCLGLYTDESSGTWTSIIDYYGYELIAYSWGSSFLYPGSKRIMMGRSDGYVRERSIAFNMAGSAYESYHITPWLDFELPGVMKEVVRVQPIWSGTAGDTLTVSYKKDSDGAWTALTQDDFSTTGIAEQPFLYMRKTGRKFRFKFSNSNANENFRVYGMKIFYEKREWR